MAGWAVHQTGNRGARPFASGGRSWAPPVWLEAWVLGRAPPRDAACWCHDPLGLQRDYVMPGPETPGTWYNKHLDISEYELAAEKW